MEEAKRNNIENFAYNAGWNNDLKAVIMNEVLLYGKSVGTITGKFKCVRSKEP